MGDVDCWGFESEPSLLDRKEELREEMCFLDTFHSRMETLEDTGLSNIENIQKEEQTRMMSSLKSLLKYICHRNKLLRDKLISLERRLVGYLYDVHFPVRFITRSSQNSRLFK